MSERLQAPKGTFDVLDDHALAREEVEKTARDLLERAGYSRIETPVFEPTALFARGVGESTDVVQKEMFSFTDAGGRSMTLRPEGTAPVCRAYAEHGMHKRPQPVKLWYLSCFFRQEAPQAGRYRQFWQVGAEALGSDDPAVDAESILVLYELLEALGVREVSLRLSSLGTPETRASYREELKTYLHANAGELPQEVRDRIELNPLRAFDSAAATAVMAGAPRLLDRLNAEDAEHFASVRQLLDAADVTYVVDSALVRGLDYYTRTVFEFTSDALGAQSGVGGGGRYDGLVEMLGGPATPGMGWAAGVERMLLASGDKPVAPPPLDVYVAYGQDEGRVPAFTMAAALRRAGHSAIVELAGRSLKGQLKAADRAGARWVAILGGDGCELKDMESGEQRTVAPDTVLHFIRQGNL